MVKYHKETFKESLACASIADIAREGDIDNHRIDIVADNEEPCGSKERKGGLLDSDYDLFSDRNAVNDIDEFETCKYRMNDSQKAKDHNVNVKGNSFK